MEGVERGSGWGRKDVRGINSDGEGAGGPLRWRRGVPGEGAGGEGHHAATLGGGGLRPDRWAVGGRHQPYRGAQAHIAAEIGEGGGQ
jgi:hypothetical protein